MRSSNNVATDVRNILGLYKYLEGHILFEYLHTRRHK